MSETLVVQRADIGSAATDMWRSVLLFIPKAIAFVAILVIGWIVAQFVLKIVNKVLERVGFDRAVERGGVGRALQRSKYDASDILAKLAFYAILLFTLQLAFGVWGPNPISDLIGSVVAWLPRAFVAIVIVVVAAAIASAVRDLIHGALGGLSYGRLLGNLASIFIIGLGVIAALNQVGIATTVTTPVLIAVLATVAGILIVGVGGGLVRPMQQRWESWLERAAAESQVIREKAQAYAAGRRDLDREMAEREAAERQMAERTQVIHSAEAPAMAGAPSQPVDSAYGTTVNPVNYGATTREMPTQASGAGDTTQRIYQSGNITAASNAARADGVAPSGDGAPGSTDLGEDGEPAPRPLSDEETQRINPQDYRDR